MRVRHARRWRAPMAAGVSATAASDTARESTPEAARSRYHRAPACMTVAPLHPHFAPDVAARLDAALQPGATWVTDADGTLWRGDLTDTFLLRLVASGVLPGDTFARYERV